MMSKPTQQQLKWADMEIGVIIHYLMDIYNPEYKAIKTIGVREHMPASIFAPTKLDTDQWIAAAKSAGAKYAVLVANLQTRMTWIAPKPFQMRRDAWISKPIFRPPGPLARRFTSNSDHTA